MLEVYKNKIVKKLDGKEVGYIAFDVYEDHYDAYTTYVDNNYRGQNIAYDLVRKLIEIADLNMKKIKPSCSYVEKWFEKNPEFSKLKY